MNILTKAIIAVLALYLGGCAHHGGYYSGYYDGGYAVGASSYASSYSYPVYGARQVYVDRPIVRKHRVHKRPVYKTYRYRDRHEGRRYDKHYTKRPRSHAHRDFRDRQSSKRPRKDRYLSDRRSNKSRLDRQGSRRSNVEKFNRRSGRERGHSRYDTHRNR
ncbi:hypothetical protein Q9L42_008740 [Methylomarinum sp. Ch1-1]|uniref:Lipoprotein n=1 Tax=Methylomarinum roseum TaxID=3067653 RepID=A0AAU7NYX3_9GAMM|nr:hypothetical protein [Methylomarinum sp. Ch1-1]MDP4521683.1 hypothetical protein [Methylomarinum sp. Ch1-1]